MTTRTATRTADPHRRHSSRQRRWTHLGVGASLLLAVTLSACADKHEPDPNALSGACDTVELRNDTPTCVALYPSAPALRLPASTEGWHYGAVTRGGDSFAVTPTRSYPLSEQLRDRIGSDTDYARTVYRARIDGDRVSSLEPAMTVPENLILDNAFADMTMTGQISLREPDGSYGEAMVPVALRVGASAGAESITAHIVNTTHGASIDGQCIPPLPTDSSNPLQGDYTADIELERRPSMHTAFDDEMVLAWNDSVSNMGTEFFPSVATLYGADDLGQTWTSTPHANPTSGPTLIVTRTAGQTATQC